MPITGTLLTPDERAQFGPWLTRCLDASGLSKNAIKRKTGVPIVRLNAFRAGSIPTPTTLACVASAIGIPWPIAFWRAGYFREVLGVIAALADATGAADDYPPMRRATIELALRAFPRRAPREPVAFTGREVYPGTLIDFIQRHLPITEKTEIKALSDGLPRLLSRAAIALSDRDLPSALRRAVAGEYVNAWADAFDKDLADEVRKEQSVIGPLESALLNQKEA